MVYLAVAIGVLLVTVILTPLFMGKGGMLVSSSSLNSVEALDGMKEALAKRYVEDEAAFEEGRLGKVAWQKRKQFLVNRYIDAARRRDFLSHLDEGETS